MSTFAFVCEAEPTTSRHTAETDHGPLLPSPGSAPLLRAVIDGAGWVEAETEPVDALLVLPGQREEGEATKADADGSASKKIAKNFMAIFGGDKKHGGCCAGER